MNLWPEILSRLYKYTNIFLNPSLQTHGSRPLTILTSNKLTSSRNDPNHVIQVRRENSIQF